MCSDIGLTDGLDRVIEPTMVCITGQRAAGAFRAVINLLRKAVIDDQETPAGEFCGHGFNPGQRLEVDLCPVTFDLRHGGEQGGQQGGIKGTVNQLEPRVHMKFIPFAAGIPDEMDGHGIEQFV